MSFPCPRKSRRSGSTRQRCAFGNRRKASVILPWFMRERAGHARDGPRKSGSRQRGLCCSEFRASCSVAGRTTGSALSTAVSAMHSGPQLSLPMERPTGPSSHGCWRGRSCSSALTRQRCTSPQRASARPSRSSADQKSSNGIRGGCEASSFDHRRGSVRSEGRNEAIASSVHCAANSRARSSP